MPGGTLVIGLGNPILGDDGVGWRVADAVRERTTPGDGIDVECVAVGGWSLMEHVLGYEKVVIVDAVHTGAAPPGTVGALPLASLADPSAGHTTSPHDTSLRTALATAAALEADLPNMVTVVGIEIPAAFEFSEELTPAVARAVMPAAELVLDCVAHSSLLPTGQRGGTHGFP